MFRTTMYAISNPAIHQPARGGSANAARGQWPVATATSADPTAQAKSGTPTSTKAGL